MHGRRRLPPGAENHMDEENKKAEKAFTIIKAALKAKSQGPCPAPILTAASAVLTRNPEVYSLWNMRRESVAEDLAGEQGKSVAQQELQLVDKCLDKNHKSYSAWHHRQWVIRSGHIDLDSELASIDKYLNVVTGDTKNFHAWKYRSWLVERAGKSTQSELDFTRNLLEAEPNNFSALHHRIVALASDHSENCSNQDSGPSDTCIGQRPENSAPLLNPGLAADESNEGEQDHAPAEAIRACEEAKMQYSGARVLPISLAVIEQELKDVYQVVEADPGNSAQWGYHLWLLRCAAAHMKAMHGAHVSDVTERVRGILQCSRLKCEQIVEDETARLGKLQACAGQHTGSVEAGGDEDGDGQSQKTNAVGATVLALAGLAYQRSLLAFVDVLQLQQRTFKQESEGSTGVLIETFQKLQEADPLRRGYYADQIGALQPTVS